MAKKYIAADQVLTYRSKTLTRRASRELMDADGYIQVRVMVPFGQVACASNDGTYGGLNDIVDGLILKDGCLEDISYSVCGCHPPTEAEPTGYVVLDVHAKVAEY